MMKRVRKLVKEDTGITALETAIILIAFIVVAAVFAFTILSAGTFSTQRAKEAALSGLSEVRGSLEVKGSVVAVKDSTVTNTEVISYVVFTLANVSGGEAVDLTTGSNKKVIIDYRDENQRVTDLSWTKAWRGYNDGDDLLEEGELAEITVPLTSLNPRLGTNTEFVIEVKPPTGAVLDIRRTTPAKIDTVVDLH